MGSKKKSGRKSKVFGIAIIAAAFLAGFYFYIEPDDQDRGYTLAKDVVIEPGDTGYLRFDTANNTVDTLEEIEVKIKATGRASLPGIGLGLSVVDMPAVAHWKFDEREGSTAHDSAGQNHGAVYGATWTAGRIGGALSFDGTDDYVSLPDAIVGRTPVNDFTVGVWLKWDGSTTYYPTAFCMFKGSAFQLQSNKASPPKQGASYHDATGWRTVWADAPHTTDWSHYVVTKSSSTGLRMYRDGVLQADTHANVDDTKNYGANNRIGVSGSAYPWGGLIDEVRIYDSVLTDAQVRQLYSSGSVTGEEEITKVFDLPGSVMGWELDFDIKLYGPNNLIHFDEPDFEDGSDIKIEQNLTLQEAGDILENPVFAIHNTSDYQLYIEEIKVTMDPK